MSASKKRQAQREANQEVLAQREQKRQDEAKVSRRNSTVYAVVGAVVAVLAVVAIIWNVGLIQRSADSQDGRGVSLDLTRNGRALYEEIFPAAIERNEDMLSVLSESEREAMERMLDKLTTHALEMLNECKAEVPARRGRGVQPR